MKKNNKQLSEKEHSRISSLLLDILEIAAGTVFVSLILLFSFDKAEIMSASMAPTLMTGDVVLYVNVFFTNIHRGDVIEFKHNNELLGKRIIAIGGDHVSFKDGYVYVNNERVESDVYTLNPASTYPGFALEYDVPTGYVFVLGDNREDSYDSRFWEDPYVDTSDIKGVYCLTLP